MGLAKSRPVVVDGVQYAWKVTEDRGWHYHAKPVPRLLVTIQRAGGGQKLVAVVPYAPITPVLVCAVIELASRSGWPTPASKPFHIDVEREPALLELVRARGASS